MALMTGLQSMKAELPLTCGLYHRRVKPESDRSDPFDEGPLHGVDEDIDLVERRVNVRGDANPSNWACLIER